MYDLTNWFYFSENEEKEKKKKKVTRVDEKEEDEEEDNQDDSQFFNMASKALKKLKRRTSMNTNETSSVSNPQPESKLQQKIFKSPKAAKPLQILVSLIFALANPSPRASPGVFPVTVQWGVVFILWRNRK